MTMKNFIDNSGNMPTRKNTGSFFVACPVNASKKTAQNGRSNKKEEYHINSIQLLSIYF